MFHARGPAAANDRSPSDDIVRGTATVLDAADLRPVFNHLHLTIHNKLTPKWTSFTCSNET